jgi:acetyltransferase-like isoleucine patch superfamily enzyme
MGFPGTAVLGIHRNWVRLRDGMFSRLVASGFAAFGRRSHLSLPVTLLHPERIHVGSKVYFGPGCWLQVLPETAEARLQIGSECSLSGYAVLSAARSIVIEPGVLFARNVYVADHSHAHSRADVPIQYQGLAKVAPVVIEAGAWLGQNVVVCPGVRIGRGAVIGANSVVRHDVPPRHLAAGVPARVIREL